MAELEQGEFEEFSTANLETLEREYLIKTGKLKIPKPPPPPKVHKATAASIRETKKYIKEKQSDEQMPSKVKILTKIEKLKSVFAHRIGKKYPKLSVKDDLNEIQAQMEEIENELSTSNSIPITKMAFMKTVEMFEFITSPSGIIPSPGGLQTKGLSAAVSDPAIFREHFDEHLTLLAIKHDLFATGPKMGLLSSFIMILATVHKINTGEHALGQQSAPVMPEDGGRYDDL